MKGKNLIQWFTLTCLSLILWLLFSGKSTLISAAYGILLALICAAYSKPVFFHGSLHHRGDILLRPEMLPVFLGYLIFESYRASLILISKMLRGKYNPGIIRVRTRLRSQTGRILLANSISYIPGTLSLWMEEDHIFVHCFDRETVHRKKAGEQIKGTSERILLRMNG